jgi:hypothetical protein
VPASALTSFFVTAIYCQCGVYFGAIAIYCGVHQKLLGDVSLRYKTVGR